MQLGNAKKASSLLILASLLSGCELARSSGILPDVVEYSAEVQKLAADELEKAGPACPRDVVIQGCSATHRMTIDYLDMRDQTRAIKGQD